MKSLRILVVDDHPLVRDAMAGLLAEIAPVVTILQAADCASALELAQQQPELDLVVLDLKLPGIRGLEALDQFRRAQPALPVVILSTLHDRQTVLQAMRRGAMGFIPKLASKDVIVNATRLVLSGGLYLPPEMVSEDAAADDAWFAAAACRSRSDLGLTIRQEQVLALIMRGQSNKEICRALGLAERTVKIHVSAVLTALRVASRTQAVIAAGAMGLNADDLWGAHAAIDP
jgi:DNA-binding NarL/FixJ family response regulator